MGLGLPFRVGLYESKGLGFGGCRAGASWWPRGGPSRWQTHTQARLSLYMCICIIYKYNTYFLLFPFIIHIHFRCIYLFLKVYISEPALLGGGRIELQHLQDLPDAVIDVEMMNASNHGETVMLGWEALLYIL